MPPTAFCRRFLFVFFITIQLRPCPVISASQAWPEEADRHYQDGLRAKSIDERIRKYQLALKSDPLFQPAIYRLGVCYFRKSSYAEAIETLQRLEQTGPKLAKNARLYLRNSYALYSQDYAEAQEFDQAVFYARRALEIDPEYVTARTTLGTAYLYLEKLDPAITELKRSLASDHDQEPAWLALGEAFVRSERYEDAANAYRFALDLNPGSDYAAFQLKRAEKEITRHPWLQPYETALAQDDFDRARQILQNAQLRFPDQPFLRELITQIENYGAGLQAFSARDWQSAIEFLEKVNPEFKDAKLRLEEARAELTLLSANKISPRVKVRTKDLASSTNATEQNFRKKLDRQTALAPLRENFIGSEPSETSVPTLAEIEPKSENNYLSAEAPSLQLEQSTVVWRPWDPGQISVQSRSKTTAFWVLLGIVTLGLFMLRRSRFASKMSTRSKEPAHEFIGENGKQDSVEFSPLSTQELFQAELISETIGFSSSQRLTESNGAFDKLISATPSLAETATMSGLPVSYRRIGRYQVEKQIGRGSMGLVFEAWDPTLDRTVAIKCVALNAYAGKERDTLRDRLHREASAAGKLSHPNIVTIHDVGEEADHSYIVMEYLKGRNLRTILDEEGALSTTRAKKIISGVCSALDFAHANGVVHRDIKPSNIILTEDNRVKVADFGIAKLPKLDTLTRPGDIVGTPFYMSPEQIEGRPLDGRSDIFSTGVLLYEMLTGCRPFDGENIPEIVFKIVYQPLIPPSELNKKLPKSFDLVLTKALAKEPDGRYKSARDFAKMLGKHGRK